MSYSTVIMVRNALSPAPSGSEWLDNDQPDPNSLTNTAADLSNAQLQDAITEADSKIDSYIGGRYTTPVINDATGVPYVAVPHPLDYWSRNIAAYLATLTNNKSQDLDETDPVIRRYNATVLDMVAVRDGKANLVIPENTTSSSEASAGQVINPYAGNLFGPCDFDLRPSSPGWGLYPGGNW